MTQTDRKIPRDMVVARPNGTANQAIPPARNPQTPTKKIFQDVLKSNIKNYSKMKDNMRIYLYNMLILLRKF